MLESAVGPIWPLTLPEMGPPQLLWAARANASLSSSFKNFSLSSGLNLSTSSLKLFPLVPSISPSFHKLPFKY